MDLAAAVFAGIAGAGGFAVLIRFGVPALNRLLGGFFAVQHTLDVDRGRVVEGLRAEIADLDRRLKRESERADAAETRVAIMEKQLVDERAFTDRLLERLNLTRAELA